MEQNACVCRMPRTFTLNGSTLGEKLNKRPAALIAWHGGVFSGDPPEDAPFAVYRSAVLNYSSSVDWLNASSSQGAGLSGAC
jgi:hypothetical protein